MTRDAVDGQLRRRRRDDAFLTVRDLRIHFPTDDGLVKSVDGLSLRRCERGQTLGIVGESGSGKSRDLPRHPRPAQRQAQRRRSPARSGSTARSWSARPPEQVRRLRGKKMAMIFQDPLSALHPFYTVGARSSRPTGSTTTVEQAGRAQARDRDARPGRHPAAGPAGRRLPAPVLRRHAAARDDRDGAGLRPASC